MHKNRLSLLFIFLYLVSSAQSVLPMARQVNNPVLVIYDSDSEDEDGYVFQGLSPLNIPAEKHGKECVPLARGIHFSPSKFTRQERSRLRRSDDAGKTIYSSAAYDLADVPLGVADNEDALGQKAVEIREVIQQFSPDDRDKFQQLYSNQYDGFHRRLGTGEMGGIFQDFASKKNPQVSTAEHFLHAGKYASGYKFLGAGIESLDPEYDDRGRPKHPYLGKLTVMLVAGDQLEELDPYFVVHGHANDNITILNNFRKNVLAEREVSFPGLVPGDCVIVSIPLRVPSFVGDYQTWHKDKYGLSKRQFDIRKRTLMRGKFREDDTRDPEEVRKTCTDSLIGVIVAHLDEKLKQHIQEECDSKGIRLVHKQLNGAFDKNLPTFLDVQSYKERIQRQKKAE